MSLSYLSYLPCQTHFKSLYIFRVSSPLVHHTFLLIRNLCYPLALLTFKCTLSQPSAGLLDAPGGSGGPMVSPPQHCHSTTDRTLRKVSAVKRSRSAAAPHTAHRGEPLYHRLQCCTSSRNQSLHSSQNMSTE